jgi:hypothetical protein
MISSKFPSSTISRKSVINFKLLKLKREIQLIIDDIEKEDDYRFSSIMIYLQLFQYQLERSEAAVFDINGQNIDING